MVVVQKFRSHVSSVPLTTEHGTGRLITTGKPHQRIYNRTLTSCILSQLSHIYRGNNSPWSPEWEKEISRSQFHFRERVCEILETVGQGLRGPTQISYWNGDFLPFAPYTTDNTLRLCSLYYLQCIVESGLSFPSRSSRKINWVPLEI